MTSIIIIVGVIFLFFACVFAIIWRYTDHDKLDKQNKDFLDKSGDHAYYDHGLIERKHNQHPSSTEDKKTE